MNDHTVAELDLTNIDGPAWVGMPGATFTMGSEKGRAPGPLSKRGPPGENERPAHQVSLSPFCLARYPITNPQYRAFVEATGHQRPEHWKGRGALRGKEDHPVVWVSWDDASAFCSWLTGEVQERFGGPVHLPTEAQWEFAARGEAGRSYPWGEAEPTPDRTNYRPAIHRDTTPVDAFPQAATPDGVFDLAGNVREWCRDRYAPYRSGPVTDPTGPSNGDWRVLRGGSFKSRPELLRGACRMDFIPIVRCDDVGFRVVW